MGDMVYVSRVLDILDERNSVLSIYTPVRGDDSLEMYHGREYDITVYSDQAMYIFKGYFEGYVKDGENYFVALRLSGEGYKVQRREFFRFTCNLTMKYSILDLMKGTRPRKFCTMRAFLNFLKVPFVILAAGGFVL
jgi:c-di-GMP-binding flagellar brake protein YcgR